MGDFEKTQEQLIEELNLLRTIIDNLPDDIFAKDTKGRFVVCNKAVAEHAEIRPPKGNIGKSDFDLYPAEKASVFYAEEQEIIRTGQPVVNKETYAVRWSTGQPSCSLTTKLPWRDKTGRIIGIIGANRDITEQKKAEQALRESEARYKAIFESAKEGILVADIETKRFKYANPAVCRMLGYTVEEMQQMNVHDIHPKEFLPQVLLHFEALARGERLLSRNVLCLRKDGTIFYADIHSTNVVIDNRLSAVGFFTDITERKNAEEALRQSEEKFRGLAERSFDMIFATDNDGKITYVSPACEKILAFKPEEMVGKSFKDFVSKAYLQPTIEYFTGIIKGRDLKSFISEVKRKDNTPVFIEANMSPIMQNGKVVGAQGVVRDITERKKSEEELQKARDELDARVKQRTADLAGAVEKLQKEIAERKHAEESFRRAEERFRTIFENTAVGLYRTTPNGRILLANPALVKMMGYTSFEELAQLNLEKQGLDPSTPRSIFKQRIEKEGSVVGLESIWIRRDGTKLFVSESAFIVRDKHGNVLYYEGTAQDITKRKEAEEKLLHYQEQLRSLASQLSLAEEQLRRRIATELHDHISQNLAISKIKLESLADPAKPDLARSLNEIIDLIAQTIDVTRSLTFEVSPPVLYELGFEAAAGWLAKQTRQRFGLEVEFTDDGKPKPLDTDIRVLLFQTLRELLVNVVKHASAHKVTVSMARISERRAGVRDRVRIIVEDDGVGFDVSRASTRDYTKGGFGLFNIRERLDHIGGSVEIRSKPGHGTRITLVAPIHKTKHKAGEKK
ncbi:MAG: PAS domain S-box protein [Sedimentisphaerales bacterium]|jgi:PAS domain S-box-containing protein